MPRFVVDAPPNISTERTHHGRNFIAALAIAFACTSSALAAGGTTLQNNVRNANTRFEDVSVAVREGYSPIPCASGVEGGAMGIHYVNAGLINDKTIDIAKPEAVMYEPGQGGKLKLLAVEYIALSGPASLQGHLFNFTGAPNRYGLPPFYELHVWAWKHNPTGVFADMNPTVSCDSMMDMAR
jgi:hypothetical protein